MTQGSIMSLYFCGLHGRVVASVTQGSTSPNPCRYYCGLERGVVAGVIWPLDYTSRPSILFVITIGEGRGPFLCGSAAAAAVAV